MGGGIAGWLTPGWTLYEGSFAPHIDAQDYIKPMIAEGEDPKPRVIEECKKHCVYWREKLERCEVQLETIIKVNPTKSCLYPMRDYVTCVEGCAQPLVHNQVKGSH